MSLDKSIKSGKDKRKDYVGAKAVDRQCRNHGDCPYCKSNREHSKIKRVQSSKIKETEL